MGQGLFFLLGAMAIVLLLVVAMRKVSLHRYAYLLDPDAPQVLSDAVIRGLHADRNTQIGLIASNPSMHVPSKVQITLGTSLPIRIQARPESMAVAVRKVVGVVEDRVIGDDELDRRFALAFDDRKATRAIADRFEARQSLVALADLGADSILLSNGLLTVELPAPFVVLPRRERIRQVLAAMRTFLSSAESALSLERPAPSWEPTPVDPWPASRPSSHSITGPVFLATFIVGMAIAIWIVGSFWDFNGRVPWQVRLDRVVDRLPLIAVLSGVAGLIATMFVPRKPLLWAFQVSWPLVAHAALVGALYFVLRGSGVPELEQALGQELEMIPAGFGTAAAAAGMGFGGGVAGAVLGKRLSRMAS